MKKTRLYFDSSSSFELKFVTLEGKCKYFESERHQFYVIFKKDVNINCEYLTWSMEGSVDVTIKLSDVCLLNATLYEKGVVSIRSLGFIHVLKDQELLIDFTYIDCDFEFSLISCISNTYDFSDYQKISKYQFINDNS